MWLPKAAGFLAGFTFVPRAPETRVWEPDIRQAVAPPGGRHELSAVGASGRTWESWELQGEFWWCSSETRQPRDGSPCGSCWVVNPTVGAVAGGGWWGLWVACVFAFVL